MFSQTDFEKIQKNKNQFLLFNIIVILFASGITFTAVITNLKGFDLATSFVTREFYIGGMF